MQVTPAPRSAARRCTIAALVHGALDAYGRYFDDPGWPR